MNICLYYQAHIRKKDMFFFVAILKSFEHLAFDRTIDVKDHIVEFYVPADLEHFFLNLMNYFIDEAIVSNLKQLPNRLLTEEL